MSGTIKKTKIEDLGFSAFFESSLKELGLDESSVARVIAEYKGIYRVRCIAGEYLAKITGKQMFKALSREDYPAVGDWVAITELNKEQAVINRILPRKTILKRKYINKQDEQIIAANIDVAFIIESVGKDYNLNRLERYFVLAKAGNIAPAIILNKVDLISDEELNLIICRIKDRFPGVDVIPTSAITERGLIELTRYIVKGKTYCFLGSSGVGKSSMINKLLGSDAIKISEINLHTGKGKHTTTNREIYFLENGGIVIDNPGMREVGMGESNAGMMDVFADVTALSKNCKYADCTHMCEPGCAILNAVEYEELDKSQYLNYLKLKKETEYYNMTELEKRRTGRKFGKYVKTTLAQLKEFES